MYMGSTVFTFFLVYYTSKKTKFRKLKISSDYAKSSLSIKCQPMKCLSMKRSYLWNVLSMKCPIYEMSYLWKVLSMKSPLYKIFVYKMYFFEMSYLWNVFLYNIFLWNIFLWNIFLWNIFQWNILLWSIFVWNIFQWNIFLWNIFLWNIFLWNIFFVIFSYEMSKRPFINLFINWCLTKWFENTFFDKPIFLKRGEVATYNLQAYCFNFYEKS